MKHFGIWAALAALIMMGPSCEQLDGGWPPIKLDKSEVHFTADGGEETVTATNYSGWWINGGYEVRKDDGGLEYIYYIHSDSTDGQNAYTYDILDGEWYKASVPNKGQGNKLIITVDKNVSGTPRKATIDMQSGDAFTTVKISQD